MRSRADHLLHAPAEPWHGDPVETWHWGHARRGHVTDRTRATGGAGAGAAREARRWGTARPKGRGIFSTSCSATFPSEPEAEPIGFAHNGFHVDEEQRFQPLRRPDPIAEPKSPTADAYSAEILDDNSSAGHARQRNDRPATNGPRTNRNRGRSGSSPTAGIPATTPTTRRATAGTPCPAATNSGELGPHRR